jgi:hypothetical protein
MRVSFVLRSKLRLNLKSTECVYISVHFCKDVLLRHTFAQYKSENCENKKRLNATKSKEESATKFNQMTLLYFPTLF